MRKNKEVQSKNRRLSLGAILGIILIIYLSIEGGRGTIEKFKLKRTGIFTKGVIYDRYSVGSKGDICSAYYFYYNDQKFYGKSYDDSEVKIGDSIIVAFLKSKPNVNRSNSFLELPIRNTE